MRPPAILASIVIVLGIAACNGGEPGGTPEPSPTAPPIATPTAQPFFPFGGTPAPTPTPPPFGIVPLVIPFGPDAIVRSTSIEEHSDGSVTFLVAIYDGAVTQAFVAMADASRAASVRACWDSAHIGGPVPDCMREELLRQLGPTGPGRPLDLATPEAGGRA